LFSKSASGEARNISAEEEQQSVQFGWDVHGFTAGYAWINIQSSEKLKSIDVSPSAIQNWSRAETILFTLEARSDNSHQTRLANCPRGVSAHQLLSRRNQCSRRLRQSRFSAWQLFRVFSRNRHNR
jgi:hypothetical protein